MVRFYQICWWKICCLNIAHTLACWSAAAVSKEFIRYKQWLQWESQDNIVSPWYIFFQMPTWLNHWCCLNVESLWMKHSTLDLVEVQTRTPHKSTRLMSLEPLNQWPLSSTWPCNWWFLHCTRNLGRNCYDDGVPSALPFYLVLRLIKSEDCRVKKKEKKSEDCHR